MIHKNKSSALLGALFAALILVLPLSPAHAQCELGPNATQEFDDMVADMEEDYNNLMDQEKNFIDLKLLDTAKREINARFDEFGKNIPTALGVWWRDHFLEAMKPQSQQMSVARAQQTMEIGKQVDAEVTAEVQRTIALKEVEANKRYAVNESTCPLDSVATAQTLTENASKVLARSIALDNQPRLLNAVAPGATPSGQGGGNANYREFAKDLQIAAAQGPGPQQKLLMEEYKAFFCDPDRGDQGCTTPGSLAGKNTDLAGLLWGNKQSIDFSSEDTQRVKDAVLRTIINPKALQPIPPSVVDTAKGGEEILKRRAYVGRLATVYNTITQMLAERAAIPRPPGDTTGTSVKDIREAAGTAGGDASAEASYREIQEAMTRDRYNDPEYVALLIGSPAEITREQIGASAIRMQQMFDIFRRTEEMVFMEAAVYAADLDKRTPDPGYAAHNTKRQ